MNRTLAKNIWWPDKVWWPQRQQGQADILSWGHAPAWRSWTHEGQAVLWAPGWSLPLIPVQNLSVHPLSLPWLVPPSLHLHQSSARACVTVVNFTLQPQVYKKCDVLYIL